VLGGQRGQANLDRSYHHAGEGDGHEQSAQLGAGEGAAGRTLAGTRLPAS
jgi:hypothetical protein